MKRHDQHFKRDFELDKGLNKLRRERQYIQEAINYIQGKIKEVDKIFKKHQQNLEQKQYLDIDRPKEVQDRQNEKIYFNQLFFRLNSYEVQIKHLLHESENLGEMGKIEDSMMKAQEAENLKRAQEEYLLAYESQLNPYKTSRVCEICGAKQALQETERKQQTHLEGKIHLGFKTIREELDKLSKRKDLVDSQIQIEQDREKYLNPQSEEKKSEPKKEKEEKQSEKRSKSKQKKKSKSKHRSRSRNKKNKDKDRKKDKDKRK